MSDGGLDRVDFFVSHAGPDAGWATWVDQRLREAGYSTITDVYDFGVGQNFLVLMNDALERADRVLLLLTPQSINRYMVETEWTNAMAAARDRVVPVIVEPCEKPAILAATVHIDLTAYTDDEPATEELIGRLQGEERPTGGERVAFPRASRDPSPDVLFPARSSLVFSPQIPPRDPFFTGRAEVLRDLEEGVRSGGSVALTQSIEGLGGVGKTALAIEHCHRARAVADIVWWVRAEQREVALADLAALAGHLGVRTVDSSVEDVAHEVRDELVRYGQRWLLVLDNVEGTDVLVDLRPAAGNGQVLITARKLPASAKVKRVSIEVLSPADAVEMLKERLPGEAEPALGRLGSRMGGLALALDQAAAYLLDTGTGADDYLAMLDAEGLAAGDDVASERTVRGLFSASMERAATIDPMTRTLVGVIAFLAPDAIPRELLTEGAKEVVALAHGKTSEVNAALAVLLGLALVESGPQGLSTHRLIQEVAQSGVADAASLQTAVEVLSGAIPDATTPDLWPAWDRMLPHVLTVLAHAQKRQLATPRTAAVAFRTSLFLASRGSLQPALELAVRAVADAEASLGPDGLDAIAARHNLAVRCSAVGRFGDALEIAERVVADYARISGVDHAETITARHTLAIRYSEVGRQQEALVLMEGVVADRERLLGGDDADTVAARHSLAIRYFKMGRFEDALRVTKQVVADRRRLLGADHPDTIAARHSLAIRYAKVGRFDEAVALSESVAADRAQLLGDDHPHTLNTRHHLAIRYSEVGRRDEALALAERVAVDRERVLGDGHPATLRSGALVSRLERRGRF